MEPYILCLLRRIINSDDRLHNRLQEIAEAFKVTGYTVKMVMDIVNEVQISARNINIQKKIVSDESDQITHEADDKTINAVKESKESFKHTNSFKTQHGCLFKFVKKVGPSIKSQVHGLKHQALNIKNENAKKCNALSYKTCNMLNRSPSFVRQGMRCETKIKAKYMH